MKCIYISYLVLDVFNRNAFQKPFALGCHFETHIYSVKRVGSKSDIDDVVASLQIFPFPHKLYPLLFPLWVVFRTLWQHGRPKFIYTDWHYPSLIAGWIFKALGSVWVADIWDHPAKRLLTWAESPQSRPWYKMLYQCAQDRLAHIYLKRAHAVVTSQPRSVKSYGVDDAKLIFHPNGVDVGRTQAVMNRLAERKPSSSFRLLYVGLVEDVRLKHMKDLLNDVYAGIGRFEATLIGPIIDAHVGDEIKSSLEGKSEVSIKGWITHEEVLKAIKEADVCLHPWPDGRETNEIYPIKIFEYMAMGKVVVASSLHAVRDVIENGKTGFLYRPDDTRKAARLIAEIKKNPALGWEISANAREAVKDYDWATITKRVIDALPLQRCLAGCQGNVPQN